VKHSRFSLGLKDEKLIGGKGGLPPLLRAAQAERQTALPNHELLYVEALSVTLALRGTSRRHHRQVGTSEPRERVRNRLLAHCN
jgi:hypothetical protein